MGKKKKQKTFSRDGIMLSLSNNIVQNALGASLQNFPFYSIEEKMIRISFKLQVFSFMGTKV